MNEDYKEDEPDIEDNKEYRTLGNKCRLTL